MSYDEITDRMNWKDELSWVAVSFASGLLLAVLFIYFGKFSEVHYFIICTICCLGFYTLSILVRIQNHRGKTLSGKTGIKKKQLKYIFPLLGFGLGLAILLID